MNSKKKKQNKKELKRDNKKKNNEITKATVAKNESGRIKE